MPFDRIEGNKSIYRCDSCDREIQMGQGRYDGVTIHELKGTFCRTCFPENEFGQRERDEGIKRMRAILAVR
jgi:hypothetical protein